MRKIIAGVVLAVCFSAFVFGMVRSSKNEVVKQASGEGKIGVIYLEGPIVGGKVAGLWGEPTGTDALLRHIRKAREDKEIKAIVLRMNTPGGSAAASQEIAEEIERVQNDGKKVVTSMGDVAASGGYWIAAGTDKIVANPATTTGSIGVIWSVTNLEELYRKIGVGQETVKSGPYKDIGSPARPVSAAEKELLQEMVNDIFEQFIAVVVKGRNMDESKVRSLADGRIYTGRQAKELGLVDELGNMYDAIDIAAQMSGIQGRPVIKEYGKESPWEKILGEPQGAMRFLGGKWADSLPLILPEMVPDVY